MKNKCDVAPLGVPDWSAIDNMEDAPAAASLRAILARLEGVEEVTFAVRGWALKIIKERRLYAMDVDIEVGSSFMGMNRWIEQMHPKHHRYYKEALAAAENLPDIPFADFAAMPRCNIKLLEKSSSGVRTLPEVIKAAKVMPEKELREKLNGQHGQHLESAETLKLTYSDGEMKEVKTCLARKAGLQELSPDDYAGALLGWCIDDNTEENGEHNVS